MANLTDIAIGWYKYLEASPGTKARMLRRLKICDHCPHREEVDRFTGVLVKIIRNDPKNLMRCGLCKCPLASLASLPGAACKGGKWPE